VKFLSLFSRTRADEPERLTDQTAEPGTEPDSGAYPVEDEPLDFSVPRERYYGDFKDRPGPCPRCDGVLKQYRATYMVETYERGIPADDFIMGNDMGWFCGGCPAVVINTNVLKDFLMVQTARPDWAVGSEIDVIGIVDVDAIPEEKRNIPLGEKNNPIPLVDFTNVNIKNKSGQLEREPAPPAAGRGTGRGGRKLGTKKNPAVVRVQTPDRAEEIMRLCTSRGWEVIVGVEPDKPEDISDVERLKNPPAPVKRREKVSRNAPCPCGSGKKYKKCCLGKD